MDKNMETTILGFIGTTIRIQSFIASSPRVSQKHVSSTLLSSELFSPKLNMFWEAFPGVSLTKKLSIPTGSEGLEFRV